VPLLCQFDDVVMDAACFQVTKAGRPVALEPKAVTLLFHLVTHRDRVVTKDELTELLWKDTFVTPNALTRLIAQLRRELGDVAMEARYIQTVHRRGYRFIAPVHELAERTLQSPPVRPGTDYRAIRVAAVVVLVLVAALAASLVNRRARGLPVAIAIRAAVAEQATDSLGFDTDPALAPDGRQIAWSSDQAGGAEIYIRDLSATSPERRLTTDGMENVEPSWSPDGRWIAYHSRARRGIWVIAASGGEPRRIAEFGSRPAWSPDGRRIAFGTSGRVMAARTQLWTVGADGAGLAPLTAAGRPEGVHQLPAWSSDGSHVAFVAGTPGHVTLCLLRLADGRLTHLRDAHMIPTLAFAADDRAILWAEGSRASHGRVWRRDLDLPGGRAPGVAMEDEAVGRVPVAGLSIAGNRLAYVATRFETNLWTLPVSRNGPPGVPRPLTRSTYRNTYPVFSPDGRRVAFQLKRPDADTEVWTIAASGGEPSPMLPENPRGFFPNWVPGGERVLAVERTERGDQFAYLNLRSGRRDIVRALDREKHPRLSPDGRFIAFHAPINGTLQVFVAPVHGGTSRQLTFSPTDTAYPSWSPDGRRLAVEVRRGEDVQIGIVGAAGGPLDVLTSDRGLHWPHSWAPDNDRIAFAGERDGRWELFSISTSTGERRQLTALDSPNGYVRYPAWSPDDTSIVFERATVRGNIWVTTITRPAGNDTRRDSAVVHVNRVEEHQR
jgi:Tol biopolymer transport system component/DNA-binding winged helix-turn-helix (wHTH) protein